MQSLIGKQLRNLYDSVLVEPIPDKLVELLLKLDDIEVGTATSPKKPATDDDSAESDSE